MGDVIVLQNDLSLDGTRRIHVMSNAPLAFGHPPISNTEIGGVVIPEGAQVKQFEDDIRLHHLEATWRARGDLVRFEQRFACQPGCPVCHGSGCDWQRMVALWCLYGEERISLAITEVALAYALATGNDPMFAWVRSLPKGIEYGAEVKVGGKVLVNLFSASWMPDRAVAVGRGN